MNLTLYAAFLDRYSQKPRKQPYYLANMSSRNQTVYSFVSGKNWKLSLAELTAYLEARNIQFEITDFSRAFFTVETENPLNLSMMDDLGGTLKIAEVAAFQPTTLLEEAFFKEDKKAKKQLQNSLPLSDLANKMPGASSGKSVFGVSVYWAAETPFNASARAIQRFLGSRLKEELRAQDKKTRFMGFPRDRKQPQLTSVEVIKQGLVEANAEILLCIGKDQTSIGTTKAVHNPFEFQKRDLDKPVQRKIFGISPRVAKIMVNLSHCTEGKVFLDPFCGVGNILQEALMIKAKVIGVDLNRWCVEGAQKNLNWLRQEYSLKKVDFKVLQGDACRLSATVKHDVDCIATEPELGPALREIPKVSYAEKIITSLKPLFTDFLREAYKVLNENGYLVIVTPYIKTVAGKPVKMNIQEIASKIGFQSIKPYQKPFFGENPPMPPLSEAASFIDVDERHKIGREISIFQKPQTH